MKLKNIFKFIIFIIIIFTITNCTRKYAFEYRALKEAFPKGEISTNTNNSNTITISTNDLANKISGIFSEEGIQNFIKILKQTEVPERDIFLQHLESKFITKEDLESLLLENPLKNILDLKYLNQKIATSLWEKDNKNPKFPAFSLEGKNYKLINGIVYYLWDKGTHNSKTGATFNTATPAENIKYYDGHYFVCSSEYKEIYEETMEDLFVSAHKHEIKNNQLVKKDIPNIGTRQFNDAPLAFHYRFMIENSYEFDEAGLTDIKEINGIFYYKDKSTGYIKPFRSEGGLYKDKDGVYYLNGHKQIVHNNQLIPQEFLDIAQKDGAEVFSYTNMWISYQKLYNKSAGEHGYVSPSKTIYVIKDEKFYYFQNGKCVETKMVVDPTLAKEIEEFSDWYIAYCIKNPKKTIDKQEIIEDGMLRCRRLMREWRDSNDQQSIEEDIRKNLNKLNDIRIKCDPNYRPAPTEALSREEQLKAILSKAQSSIITK